MSKTTWALAATFLFLAETGSATGAWVKWETTDLMSNMVRKGIASEWTAPLSPMRFPYQDVVGVAGIACDSGAYFRFSTAPNLVGDENHDGYSSINLRVRFDDKPVEWVRFNQEWGSDQLTPRGGKVKTGLLAQNTMLLELPWHGEKRVVFRFDLTGSREVYNSACPESVAITREPKGPDTAGSGSEASGTAPKPEGGPAYDPVEEQERYQFAFDLLSEGRFERAATAFAEFLAVFPNSHYRDTARFWKGECLYVLRRFDPALSEFRMLVENHPDSSRILGARLKIGFILHELGRPEEAAEELKALVGLAPYIPRQGLPATGSSA